MSASTVPTVRSVLATRFKAAVESSTEVWTQPPAEDHQLAENVYIEGVRGRRKFVSFPATQEGSREEVYEVKVSVEVFRSGTADAQGTEERMWTIVNQIEAPIQSSPTLERNSQWAIAGSFEQSTAPLNDGVLAKYVFGVEVSARI